MSSIEESVEVAVPVSAAYNQWTQFESFPEFMTGVKSVTQTDDTHLHWVVNVAGQRHEFDAEITEQHPDERVAWRSTDRKHAGVVTFHKLTDASAKVMVQLDWDTENLVEKAAATVGADDAQVKIDLQRFKQLIEDKGGAAGWRGEVPRS